MADPNKWLGLLKWSMKYQDGTTASPAKAMAPEDREFLEKVLKEAVLDETERIQQILRIAKGENPSVVFAKEDQAPPPQVNVTDEELADYRDALLDELLVRIDQIDNARNFVKMDGLDVMRTLMETETQRPETRALAAEVCSVVVQNNPFCQDAALKAGLLPVFCKMTEDKDVTCRVKALLGLSCLVRNHVASEVRFLSKECNGLSVLLRFLKGGDVDLRLVRKSVFFLRYLVRNSPITARVVLPDAPLYISSIAAFIGHDDIELSEGALQALLEFAELGPEYLAACKQVDNELNVSHRLTDWIAKIDAMSDEDKEYSSEIASLATKLRTVLTA